MPYQQIPILTPQGQSGLGAIAETLAGWAQKNELERNEADKRQIDAFKQSSSSLYGDAYDVAVKQFAARPEMQRAMQRYGQGLDQPRIEPPEEMVKRTQSEWKLNQIQKGSQKGAPWQSRIDFMYSIGQKPTNFMAEQFILEDETLNETERDAILVRMKLKPEANKKLEWETKQHIADVSNEIKREALTLKAELGRRGLALGEAELKQRVQENLDRNANFQEKMRRLPPTMSPQAKLAFAAGLKEVTWDRYKTDQLVEQLNAGVMLIPKPGGQRGEVVEVPIAAGSPEEQKIMNEIQQRRRQEAEMEKVLGQLLSLNPYQGGFGPSVIFGGVEY